MEEVTQCNGSLKEEVMEVDDHWICIFHAEN
jgi:hypothetical protein